MCASGSVPVATTNPPVTHGPEQVPAATRTSGCRIVATPSAPIELTVYQCALVVPNTVVDCVPVPAALTVATGTGGDANPVRSVGVR